MDKQCGLFSGTGIIKSAIEMRCLTAEKILERIIACLARIFTKLFNIIVDTHSISNIFNKIQRFQQTITSNIQQTLNGNAS